jgi:cytochrome c556
MIRTAISTSVNRMVRGQAPYDQAKVDAAFDQIVSSSKKFTTLYPVMPSPLPRRAHHLKTNIVRHPRCGRTRMISAKNADVAKVVSLVRGSAKNLDTLKSAYADIGKACDACHEPYRLRAN